jgi:4-carboxymuconolactone decarboxylase
MTKRIAAILFAAVASLAPAARIRAQSAAGLPKDVYPDSRFRLPLPKKEEMDDYGKKVFDMMMDPGRRGIVGLQGPTGIRLHSPRIAEAMGAANTYLRLNTGFGDRLTEIAILTTAREMDNQFEWFAHEATGRKAGVEPAIIDLIKLRKPVTGLGEKETVIIGFGRELFGQKKVSSATFAEALRLFGRRGVVDLASLMAHYAATSALLNAFDMQLPEGQKPPLPAAASPASTAPK